MAYTGKRNRILIMNTFPADYENLFSMLSVKRKNVKLKNEESFFKVHPEYDVPYKLRCVILSSNSSNWIPNFQKLFDKNNPRLTHKGNTHWKDYMFQIPGIYKMLGIQRGYSVGWIEKTIQEPLPFLYLVYVRLYCTGTQIKISSALRRKALDLVEIALDAYAQKKESNRFDMEQLETCSCFLFEYSLFENVAVDRGIYEQQEIGRWRIGSGAEEDDNYTNIELRLKEVIDSCVGDMKGVEELYRDSTWEKGNSICFPEYMTPIICGLYTYQGELPFSTWEDKPKDRTLWRNYKIPIFPGVGDESEGMFYDLILYMINKSIMKENAISIMTCRKMEEIDVYLKKYYTFCVGTLQYMSLVNNDNREAAKDSFERCFSLYLFREETDLLYQKISSVAEKLLEGEWKEELRKRLADGFLDDEENINEEELKMELVIEVNSDLKKEFESKLKLELAVCMADFFSSDILHEIFCSPGICHRILLARYINKIGVSEEQLEAAYLVREFSEGEYLSADKLRTAIQDINRIYQYEEQVYVREDLQAYSRKKTSEKQKNVSDYEIIQKMCYQIPEYLQYKEFYNKLDENMNNIKTNLKKETTRYTKYVAECLLKEGKFESPAYRFLHFWVIMSSF